MAVKERSFWSTTSGVVTGIAGTLTGVVGIVTLATQMGWIGGSDGGEQPANGGSVATSVAPGGARGSTGGSGGTSTQSTAVPVFSLQPTSLTFDSLSSRKATVTVTNVGSEPMTVQGPTVEGTNRAEFSASSPSCTGRDIRPRGTCEVEVTFNPTRSGTYKASLVVRVAGAQPQDVALSGQSLL